VIYVVETGGIDLRVRMPPTAHFGPEAPVGIRHAGGRPPVYDPQTEKVVA
jgi:sn-glycerol 3-phosphate transport system ATP-binding protein/multiple sugar transport system ATP-binding protein